MRHKLIDIINRPFSYFLYFKMCTSQFLQFQDLVVKGKGNNFTLLEKIVEKKLINISHSSVIK